MSAPVLDAASAPTPDQAALDGAVSDAERSALAACLLDGEAVGRTRTLLDAAAFLSYEAVAGVAS